MKRKQKVGISILMVIAMLSLAAMVYNQVHEKKGEPTKELAQMETYETEVSSEGCTAESGMEMKTETSTSVQPHTVAQREASLWGTWVYRGKDYIEYVTFGRGGEYGYLAAPEDGTEQSFSGSYQVSQKSITTKVFGEEETQIFALQKEQLMLGGKPYTKFMDQGSEEHMQDETDIPAEQSADAAKRKEQNAQPTRKNLGPQSSKVAP